MLVLLIIDAVLSYGLAVHFSGKTYDGVLCDSARSLATQVKFNAGRATLDLPQAALEIFEWDVLDRTYFAVISERHGLILGHGDFPLPLESPDPDLQPDFYDASLGGTNIRAVAIRLPTQEDRITVLVGETLAKRYGLTTEVLAAMLVPQLVLVLVAVLLLRIGIRGGLAPLDAVAAEIGRRDPNDLAPFPETGPTELRPLTRALNEMLCALTAAHASQRRFISNAAHQLRSPLAALQVQAERALRESEPAVHAQVLTRGTDLGYAGQSSGAMVRGDPALLRELLTNLIDNALRYGKAGGRVTVDVQVFEGVELRVDDDGPGIPKEWRVNVFDRFVRLPGSRGECCGLGLAIVREIVSVCHGTVVIGEPEEGTGTLVKVSFPMDSGEPG